MLKYLMHTHYKLSREQQLCLDGVGSDSIIQIQNSEFRKYKMSMSTVSTAAGLNSEID